MIQNGKAVEGEAVFYFECGDRLEGIINREGDGVVDQPVQVMFYAADV